MCTRLHPHHTSGIARVGLQQIGRHTGMRELMPQNATKFIITDPRTKRHGTKAEVGQMEGDIGRRATRTCPRGKKINQTLTDAKD